MRVLLCTLIVLAPAAASAQAGSALGEPSADAALANAVTARPGDTGAIARNPGALGDVDRPVLSLTAHAADLDLWFARTDEGGHEMGRTVAGVGGGLVGRLPGPDWLRRVRLGVGVHLPTAHVLRLSAPPREDRPTLVAYGDRAARTGATAALGVELPFGLGLGVGLSLTPFLRTSTVVGYDATRGDTPDDNVVIDVENELLIESAAMAGLRFAPIAEVALGLAWRGQQDVRAKGPNDTRAGAVVVDAEVDFFELFAPEEVAAGLYVEPVGGLRLSGDVVWARWSRFRTIHDRRPSPRFEDVVAVRVGVEWTPTRFYRVRAGWGFEPSPVPEQTGVSSYVDGDRHVIGLGAGVDLEELDVARLRVDLHARWHLVERRRHTKDPASLPDAHADLPGRQIDNRGYPGFATGGGLGQIGVTVTFPLGAREEHP